MKAIFLALTVLFATCASTYAQTRPTGTWQADGGWEVVLGADGSQVTGMVGECPRTGSEILDGRIDGNKITFKCNRDDRFGAIAFTGTINGDEIALTWQLPSGENSAAAVRALANSPMFGDSTRSRFTVRRVPDGDLAKTAAEMALRVRGVEFSAAVNIQKDNLRVIGTLFLPQRVNSVRVVVVAFRWGSGSQFYPNPEVRKLAETIDAALLLTDFATITTPTNYSPRHDGADGLLMLLQHLAQESGHRELRDAPLVLWGHSAATSLPGTFAGVYPNRVIAMVRYHAGSLAVLGGDLQVLSKIPALFLIQRGDDGTDTSPPTGHSRDYWRSGRSVGAPWTYSVNLTEDHGSDDALRSANRLVIPWITAVVRQRLPSIVAPLRVINEAGGWLGEIETRQIAQYEEFLGSKQEATWLPDEASAKAWQAVQGAGK